MKTKLALATVALLSILNPQLSTVHAQGTAFTYQGRLNDGANPANGSYDLLFTVYDALTGGSAVGGPLTNSPTSVSNGLFTVTLDFGNQFPGAARWLEIGVRTNGNGAFTTLSPRQKLTPTPYAITASNLTGALPATQLSGTVPSAQLSGTYSGALTLNNAANSFTGNGTGLTNVNAATLGGAGRSNFWQLGGNNVIVGQFLGSTNNQPLELRANGIRVLRLEPGAVGAPNLVGGSPNNVVDAGVVGATIAGGGATNYSGVSYTNRISADHGFIGGGIANVIQTNAYQSAILGGAVNTIQSLSTYSTIGAGYYNTIEGSTYGSTIAGGGYNTNHAGANYSAIGGGLLNLIQAPDSIIAGGQYNAIQSGASSSSIGGGQNNSIQTGASQGAISGGVYNVINASSYQSVIGGGNLNIIASGSERSTIGGGNQNVINTNAPNSTIAGGFANSIDVGATNATIAGGALNYIAANASAAAIPGGLSCQAAGPFAFAAGRRAKANHPGAFVWADSVDADFTSTASNQFLIRASGGVGIGDASPAGALHIVAPTGAPPGALNPPDNGLLLGLQSTSGYKWIQSYGGDLALNPVGNNVGIGKINPASALDVNGTVTATSFSGNGSGLTGVVPAGGSGNYIQNQTAADQAAGLRINGNGIFNVGNVGIGVTSPLHLLHAGTTVGTGAINGSANKVVVENSGASGRAAFLALAGPGAAVSANRVEVQLEADVSQNRGIFGTTSNHELQMRINNNEVMRLWTNGNVSIGAVTPTNKLHVAGGVSATAFVSTSDRNAKEHFAPVSPREVLAKVATLPITTWNFKELHDGRHMGPMAQDFYAAFGLGGSDTTITSVDPDGVALAAIQGLNQKLEQKETEIAELKQRLEALEQIILKQKPD